MANNTNVDYYVAGFDAAGKRVGSLICDFDPAKNPKQLSALTDKAQGLFTDAEIIEVITSEYFNAYLEGKVRDAETGKPVDYVAPEPTAEEKAAQEKATLKAEYESGKADLLSALQTAQLNGDTAAVASIQQEYAEFNAAYKDAVEGVE